MKGHALIIGDRWMLWLACGQCKTDTLVPLSTDERFANLAELAVRTGPKC